VYGRDGKYIYIYIYEIVVENLEERKPFRKPKDRWEANIKMDLT
jgi:hypothetical protein